MKVLTINQYEAKALADQSNKEYYLSTCDVDTLDYGYNKAAEDVLNSAMGETQCYRTDDGDIFAWWE